MNPARKLIFSAIFSTAIIAASFVFCLFPSALAVRNTLFRISGQKIFLEKIESRRDALDSIKNNWENNNEKLRIINERIAGNEEVIDLVMILENLAERVKIGQEMSIVRQEEQGESVLLKNSISGDFTNLMQYIKGVENAKYPIDIESCLISKQGGQEKAELLLKIPIKIWES